MSIQRQSSYQPVHEQGTRTLWRPTEVSRRRTFQTINLRSVATPASVHVTDPLHSANSKTIRQSSTDPFPIQDQSVNQKPILYQSANPPPTHQSDANLIILDKSNPWKICQSITNPSTQRQFCTNQCVPIHHQSANPLHQGPVPNHQMAPPHIYQHQS